MIQPPSGSGQLQAVIKHYQYNSNVKFTINLQALSSCDKPNV